VFNNIDKSFANYGRNVDQIACSVHEYVKWYADTKLAKELTAHDHKYDIFHQHAVKEIQDLRAEMQELNKTLGQLQNQVLTLRR
jgi:hypothetical protein